MSLLNNGHGFPEHQFLQTMRSALPSPPSTPISTDVHRGAGASRPGQETSGRAAGCLHTPALTSQAPGYKVSECKSSSEPRKSPFRDSQVCIDTVLAPGVRGDCPWLQALSTPLGLTA